MMLVWHGTQREQKKKKRSFIPSFVNFISIATSEWPSDRREENVKRFKRKEC